MGWKVDPIWNTSNQPGSRPTSLAPSIQPSPPNHSQASRLGWLGEGKGRQRPQNAKEQARNTNVNSIFSKENNRKSLFSLENIEFTFVFVGWSFAAGPAQAASQPAGPATPASPA